MSRMGRIICVYGANWRACDLLNCDSLRRPTDRGGVGVIEALYAQPEPQHCWINEYRFRLARWAALSRSEVANTTMLEF